MSLMLPLCGNEPPDDIFPQKPSNVSKIMQQDTNIEETLLELWAKIKKRFNDIEIRNDQVASWFSKIHHLEVGLIDFEPPKPPSKFSVEILSDFLQSIDRNTVR
jgi:hypothetical protein